jgi:hypothetical protein
VTAELYAEPRRCRIPLPRGTSDAQRRELAATLGRWDAIEELHVGEEYCRLRYAFPAVTFAAVRDAVRTCVTLERLPPAVRLRLALRAVREDNEREYRRRRCGWHASIEAVYASAFARQHRDEDASRHRSWEAYLRR